MPIRRYQILALHGDREEDQVYGQTYMVGMAETWNRFVAPTHRADFFGRNRWPDAVNGIEPGPLPAYGKEQEKSDKAVAPVYGESNGVFQRQVPRM